MQFGLSESQQILKDTSRKFFAGECAMPETRKLMETETAYDPALWRKLADQGFTGIIIPEEFGGMGLGLVELILLMEEAGYALLPGPLYSTVMAGAVLNACGSAAQKQKFLPRIASGDARATPRAIAAAAWRAVKLPLNLSGAITTRMVAGPVQDHRPLTPRLGLRGVSSVDRASLQAYTIHRFRAKPGELPFGGMSDPKSIRRPRISGNVFEASRTRSPHAVPTRRRALRSRCESSCGRS